MKRIILIFLFFVLPISAWAALININTADLAELDKIPEVGPAIAGKIITYRTSNGPFKTIEEIKNVSGIGDVTFLKMRDFITIGSGNIPPAEDTSLNQTTSDNDSGQTSGEDNLSEENIESVHTNEIKLSNYKKETLQISAGRERLATVRTPIMFSASQNKNGTKTNYFLWSFGDGTSAIGLKVYHTYQFPGRYNVTLNGSIDDKEEAVARTIVLVTEAKIKVTAVNLFAGYVEITNNSDKEQNLNNWSLRADDKKYVFPLDTIISPQAPIKIPLKQIGFASQNIKDIAPIYPDGEAASGASLQNGQSPIRVAESRKQLAKAKQQIAENVSDPSVAKPQVPKPLITGTTSRKNVIVLAKEPNWFEKIKHAIFE
ncbi:MAG: helix-hairpin-helix domain-containing protein [Candidatus Paceibacterota bacterium]|jgi:competence ComEA-like helix-hairpin-helix protein